METRCWSFARRWGIPLLLVGIVAGVGWLVWPSRKTVDLAQVVQCNSLGPYEQERCYERVFGRTIEREGIAAALSEIQSAQAENILHEPADCHMLAHFLGHEAFHRYPDKDAAMEAGGEAAKLLCAGGYVHGVLESYFQHNIGSLSIHELQRSSCPGYWDAPESALGSGCFHGIGHGLMISHANAILTVLQYCVALSQAWQQQACDFGIFMEYMYEYWPNYDRGPRFLPAKTMAELCLTLDERWQQNCFYFAGTAFFYQAGNRDYRDAFRVCDTVASSQYRTACYDGAARSIGGTTTSLDKIKSICDGAAAGYQERCTIYAAHTFFSYVNRPEQQPEEFCAAFPSDQMRRYCSQVVAGDFWVISNMQGYGAPVFSP